MDGKGTYRYLSEGVDAVESEMMGMLVVPFRCWNQGFGPT